MTKLQKLARIAALALGLLLVLGGLILLVKSQSHTGHSGGLSRASTSIRFGADFYTSSAQYTGLAANALVDLYTLVRLSISFLFIFLGGLDCCVVLCTWKKEDKAEAPVPEQADCTETSLRDDSSVSQNV